MPSNQKKKIKPILPPKSQREGNPPFKGVTVRDHQYSESYDEYLEIILRLSHQNQNSGEWVKNKSISKALKVKAPSVTNMLEKLSRAKFINWIPRKGVKLTDLGIARATELISYHTIMELFLNRVLKIEDPNQLDGIACDFEHHFTPTLKELVKTLLGIDEDISSALSELMVDDHFHRNIHTNPVYSEVETYILIDTLKKQITEKLELSGDQQEQLDAVIKQFKTDTHESQCSLDTCPTKDPLI
jgi:Mn-dependent DtxR family transcriptional regulator